MRKRYTNEKGGVRMRESMKMRKYLMEKELKRLREKEQERVRKSEKERKKK